MVVQAQNSPEADARWSKLYDEPISNAEAQVIQRNLAAFVKLMLRLDQRAKMGQQPLRETS